MKTSFRIYLQKKQYSNTSIESYERIVNRFLQWTENENVQVELIRYSDILAYMDKCKGYSRRTVQHIVITLGHYFDCLVESGVISSNPAKGVKVHGVKRRTLHKILEPEELDSIYQNFPTPSISQKKNKVIIGLLVYQGLKTEELERLSVSHVKLNEGKIQVLGSRTGNGRLLSLEPKQVLDMHVYVNEVRPAILARSGQRTDRLLVSVEGGFKVRISFLMSQLRKHNPKIEKADQLRASVIVKWLRQYNLRQAQYFAGHRFISSTEAYLPNDMEGLTEEVNRFHPLA